MHQRWCIGGDARDVMHWGLIQPGSLNGSDMPSALDGLVLNIMAILVNCVFFSIWLPWQNWFWWKYILAIPTHKAAILEMFHLCNFYWIRWGRIAEIYKKYHQRCPWNLLLLPQLCCRLPANFTLLFQLKWSSNFKDTGEEAAAGFTWDSDWHSVGSQKFSPY